MKRVTAEKKSVEPVRKSVTVDAPVEHAFMVFTQRMGDWWPIKTHSVHEVEAVSAGMERRPAAPARAPRAEPAKSHRG